MTKAPPAPARGLRNRPISRFVLAFAALSFVASVLPLLTHGAGDESLLPLLERGTSFVVYSVFLLLFVFFFLPGAFRGDPGRGLSPWSALAAFSLLFASIPGVTSAYISGVARPQALFMGGLIAAACAVVILLRALFGRFAVVFAFGLGCLTLFVLPAVETLAWSTGTPLAVSLGDLSMVSWLRRLAFLRDPVDPRGVLAAAGALWLLVVVVAATRALRAPAFAAALVLLVPALGDGPSPPEVTLRPLLGPVARAGARIPIVITAKGGGEVEISFKSESLRVPADGQPYTALVTLAPLESEAEATVGRDRFRVPLPVRWVEAPRPIVGILGGLALGDSVPTVLSNAEVAAIDLAALPPVAGALEVFDAIVIGSADWDSLRPPDQARLEGYAALSGTVVVVGGPTESGPESRASDARPTGPGIRRVATPWGLAELELRRHLDPDAFDPTLKSLFARPDWQALDLTKLLLFLLLYHGAFVLAFLLPLVLDSHKSRAVYLVSVGTVMVVVVGAAWWSLRQFFLRDNQVYTQSLTYVAVRPGGADAVVRQFRCYASMSGERRDFPWSLERDQVAYRDAAPPQRMLDLRSPRRLDDVWLDRFHSKLLVREDFVQRSPISVVVEDGGFRVRPVADVPDPLGLRLCGFVAAAVIEPDGTVRAATVQGQRIVVGETAGPGQAGALDSFARALLGRFRRGDPGSPRRLLIVRASGVNRLDGTSGFFQTADLDALLTFDV